MPSIDVTGVLRNRRFADNSLIRVRNTQTVGANGIAADAPADTPFAGVVTAAKGSMFVQDSEGRRIARTIRVACTLDLTDGSAGEDADLVYWQSRSYTVKDVKDYSTYGAGFCIAECELISLTGPAPETP